MAPESVSKCQVCDKPATSVCGGCQSATYSHYYCSKACQKQDWPYHKTSCSDLKIERVLIRVSTILQAAYLKFRENTWNMPIIKVEDDGRQELIIHRGSDNDKDYFLRFPAHLMKTTAIKNQVLCTSMCSESIAWMHETIAGLLSGLNITIEELTTTLSSVPRYTTISHPNSLRHTNLPTTSHALVRITSTETGAQWAIDLANAQFGIDQHLWRWAAHKAAYITRVVKIYPFGTHKELMRRQAQVCDLDCGLVGEVVAHMDRAVSAWQEEFKTPLRLLGSMGEGPTASAAASLLACMQGVVSGFIRENDFTERVRRSREYEAVHKGVREREMGKVVGEFLKEREVLVGEEGMSADERADEFLRKLAEELEGEY
ncbi:MYND-type zinc finger protein samB [Parastagonospora nodorum]|nr:MYND-type zinc finger protein samB [Parastagonospora nodorum]